MQRKIIYRYSGALLFCLNNTAHGNYYFNPAFLASDPSAVADLSFLQSGTDIAPGKYKIDVYVNGNYSFSHQIIFISKDSNAKGEKQLRPVFTIEQLFALGVRTDTLAALKDKKSSDLVSIEESIPDANVVADFSSLRLDLSVPQIAMRNDARGFIPPEQWDQGINALLLNYNFTGNKDWYEAGVAKSNFLSLKSGLNIGAWRLRDNSSWNRNVYTSGRTQSEWQHISTFIERDIEALKGVLISGDTSTRGDIFDSYPFRGIKVESDENMLPDSQRGFAPTIRGIARGNAKVTVRQNNYVLYQTYVSAGAFEINDLFPTSSSGDLQVTITESDGSVRTIIVPYSSVPGLQRDGHVTYSLSAGKYHSGSGAQNTPEVAQGTFFWGAGKGYTLYSGAQVSDNYKSLALGIGKNLGTFGAISMDLTSARSTLTDGINHVGRSVRFLYAKSLNTLGTTFNLTGYRYSTEGFYTFSDTTYKMMNGYNSPEDGSLSNINDDESDYANYYNLYYAKKGKIQLSVNQSLGEWGSFYISGTEQSYWHTSGKDTYYQAGFNSTFHDINYSINYSYNSYMGQPNTDQVLSINLSFPLGKWLSSSGGDINSHNRSNTYLTYNNSIDHEGRTSQTVGMSGSMLEDGNLDYSVQQGYVNQGEGNSGNTSLNYRGTYNNLNVGYNYSADFHQVNYGIAGGVVIHRNGITFSQPLGETNILVAAPGAAGVSLENNTGVKTDWRGYAVIPYASSYRMNRVALNTRTLNNRTDLADSVMNVVPTSGAIVRAEFSPHTGERVLMTLLRAGKPVPFGAMVSGSGRNEAAIVGDDGLVYLPGIEHSGTLLAQWGTAEDQQCSVHFRLPRLKNDEPIIRMNGECQ